LKHRVLCLEPGGLLARDGGVVEAAAHHLDIGGRIAMRRRDLGMTEPGLDSEQVDTRLQQRHGEGVAQNMG
jgi:hypothetical protein